MGGYQPFWSCSSNLKDSLFFIDWDLAITGHGKILVKYFFLSFQPQQFLRKNYSSLGLKPSLEKRRQRLLHACMYSTIYTWGHWVIEVGTLVASEEQRLFISDAKKALSHGGSMCLYHDEVLLSTRMVWAGNITVYILVFQGSRAHLIQCAPGHRVWWMCWILWIDTSTFPHIIGE